jgi:hypothetical protein
MPYPKKAWTEPSTGTAADLNRMELGIALASILINVKEAPFSVVGSGTVNDAPGLNEALALAGVGGEEAVVWIPLGDYRCEASLKVPANVRIIGASMYRCRVLAKGNIDLFQFTAGNNRVEGIYAEAETAQASGSAFDLSHGFTTNIRFREIKVGNNFFNGFYCVGSGALIGGLHFLEIHFVASASAVKSFGNAAMVIGSSACRVAGVWIRDFHGQANENKDMPKWLEVNNVDSMFVNEMGLQNSKEGFVVGNNDTSELQTTGLKVTDAWVDSVPTEPTALGWKIQKCKDGTFTNCNAQNCAEGAYIGLETIVTFSGGTFQSNRGHGMRVASTVTSLTLTGGMTISDNNAAGSAVAGEGAGLYLEAGASNVTVGAGVKIGNFMAQGQKQRYAIRIGKSATSKNIFIAGAVIPEKGSKPATGPIRENTVAAILNEQEGTEAEQKARGILIGATPVNAYS